MHAMFFIVGNAGQDTLWRRLRSRIRLRARLSRHSCIQLRYVQRRLALLCVESGQLGRRQPRANWCWILSSAVTPVPLFMRCACIIGVAALGLALVPTDVSGSPAEAVGNFSSPC